MLYFVLIIAKKCRHGGGINLPPPSMKERVNNLKKGLYQKTL